MGQPGVIGDHFFIIQPVRRAARRADVQTGLPGILHGKPGQIQPGIVADHVIGIPSVILRLPAGIFSRTVSGFLRFARNRDLA